MLVTMTRQVREQGIELVLKDGQSVLTLIMTLMTSEWDYSNNLKSKIWKQLIAQMFTWQCARGLLFISFMKFKRPKLQCTDLEE